VFTSLAEGADRLVAKVARSEFSAQMLAVLPMPADDYAGDFATAESRAEFFEMLNAAPGSFVVECGGSARGRPIRRGVAVDCAACADRYSRCGMA